MVKAHVVPLLALHRPILGFTTPALVQVRDRIDATGRAVVAAHVVRGESFHVPVRGAIGIVKCQAVDRARHGAADRELVLLATSIGRRRRQTIRGGAPGQVQSLLRDGGRRQVDQVATIQLKASLGKGALEELALVIRIATDQRSIRALELVFVAAFGFKNT